MEKMTDDRKYKYYLKYYKRKCSELSVQVTKLQTIIDSCRMLLEGTLYQTDQAKEKCESLPALIASTPKSTPRRLSFTSTNAESDDEVCMSKMEPGGNKWECISDEERLNGDELKNDSQSTDVPFHDPDETYDEIAEKMIGQSENKIAQEKMDVTPNKLNSTSLSNKTTEFSELEMTPLQTKAKKQRKAITPKEHICKLPRCKEHQPFYVSSIRKIAKLSPQSRLMATNRHGKSPKGFYSLDMPSTQFIQSRK